MTQDISKQEPKQSAQSEPMHRCSECGAGPLGNCGFYGCKTPRTACPRKDLSTPPSVSAAQDESTALNPAPAVPVKRPKSWNMQPHPEVNMVYSKAEADAYMDYLEAELSSLRSKRGEEPFYAREESDSERYSALKASGKLVAFSEDAYKHAWVMAVHEVEREDEQPYRCGFVDGWYASQFAALAASPEAEKMRCVGYPHCDGDLPGEGHEPSCPLYVAPEAESVGDDLGSKEGAK